VAGKPNNASLRFPRLRSLFGLAVVTTGCAALAASEQPALLVNPSASDLAELQQVVSAALHGAPVRLADDVLTRESVLTIDRVEPRAADGAPLDGRQIGQPRHFRLVKSGSHCFLIQEGSGKHWPLRTITCTPLT
jgi:hypothetical protein